MYFLGVNLQIDESEGSAKATIAIVPKDQKGRKDSSSSSSSSDEEKVKYKKAPGKTTVKTEEVTLVTGKPSGACFICNQVRKLRIEIAVQ